MFESTLGDISLLFKTGKTPPSKIDEYFLEDYNWYTPSDIGKSKILSDSERNVSEIAVQDKKATIYPEKSLLITCIGDIGRVGISNEVCSSNQQITAIKPKPEININYLYYWFIKNKKLLNDTSNNAVVPILNNNSLKKIKFNYPPLETQIHIAQILDDAAALRDKTEQLLDEYDQLAQSIFLEMFGDPVTNPKGWKQVTLGKLIEITSSKRIFKNEYVDNGVPFYRTKEIVELSKGNNISLELFISEKRYAEIKSKFDLPQMGDILISAVGTIGVMWTVDTEKPFYFKDGNLILLKSSKLEHINTTYLRMTLEHLIEFEKYKLAEGGAYNALTIAKLKEFNVLLATSELQNQFAEKIALIEQQKALAKQELQESEDLFNCLLQKAFKGELM